MCLLASRQAIDAVLKRKGDFGEYLYMSKQYGKILAEGSKKKDFALAKNCVAAFVEDYNYAA